MSYAPHPSRSFGRRLRRHRRVNLYTRGQLAERVGCSETAIQEWESDESRPRFDFLIRLAEVFDLTLDELMRGRTPGNEG